MKVKISGSCSMYVLGMDMNCPMCRKLVQSGETHQCERKEIEAAKKPKKLRKVNP